jgi:hypothetical protein
MVAITQVPDLPYAAAQKLKNSQDDLVKRVGNNIRYFSLLFAKLPREYKWKFRNFDAFKAGCESIARGDVLKLNQFYWRDQLECCEAYVERREAL